MDVRSGRPGRRRRRPRALSGSPSSQNRSDHRGQDDRQARPHGTARGRRRAVRLRQPRHHRAGLPRHPAGLSTDPVHARPARGRGRGHGRRLRARGPPAGLRGGPHRAGPRQRARHDLQRGHGQDADGRLRRPLAEPQRAPGTAPQRPPGRHGAPAVQVGSRDSSRPRRAPRAAPRLQDGHGAAVRARLPLAAPRHPGRGGRGGDRPHDLHPLARARGSRCHGGGGAPASRRGSTRW